MRKLVSSPQDVGIDADEVRANPGIVVDVHEDVLRDLMRTNAPIERVHLAERGDAEHPRRRVCV